MAWWTPILGVGSFFVGLEVERRTLPATGIVLSVFGQFPTRSNPGPRAKVRRGPSLRWFENAGSGYAALRLIAVYRWGERRPDGLYDTKYEGQYAVDLRRVPGHNAAGVDALGAKVARQLDQPWSSAGLENTYATIRGMR